LPFGEEFEVMGKKKLNGKIYKMRENKNTNKGYNCLLICTWGRIDPK